jgi:hypothetical protein
VLLAIKVLHKKGHTSYDFGVRLDREPEGQVEFTLRYKRFYLEWNAARLIVARLHFDKGKPMTIWEGPLPVVGGWQKVPLQYERSPINICQARLLSIPFIKPSIFPDPDWIHEVLSTLH